MKKRRLKWRSLSFTILSDDPQKKVTRFKVPRFFFPILALIIFITITITTYLFIHYFEESKKLALHNEQLISELNEEEQKSRQLITEVGALKEKELEVEQQLNMLYDLESQVKETMEDLPVSVEPSGGMDITISEEEAKLIHEEASELTTKASKLIQRYENTLEVIRKTNEELQFIPTEWPVAKNKITSEFSLRKDPYTRVSSFHMGVDIRGNIGDPVFSAADGEVLRAEYFGGYGNLIVIKHSNKHTTWYAHLSSIDVDVGDHVKKGEIIGAVGSTGRSTGPHLHYEIFEDGEPIDPYTYLSIFDNINKGE